PPGRRSSRRCRCSWIAVGPPPAWWSPSAAISRACAWAHPRPPRGPPLRMQPRRKRRSADTMNAWRLRSDDEQVDELVDRRGLEALAVLAQGEDPIALLGREAAREVRPELLQQQRNPLGATAAVAYGILDVHLARVAAVGEEDLDA